MTDKSPTLAELQPVGRASVVDSVIERLEELVFTRLEPGETLPSEGQLAEALGVSRLSVREATRTLEARGLLHISKGRRPRVAAPNGSLVGDFFQIAVRRDPHALLDLLEVRRALEVHIAALAARRATTGDIADMEMSIGAMRAADHEFEAFHTADVRFHENLAAASGNRMLVFLIEAFAEPLRESRQRSFAGHRARGGHVDDVIEQHEAIVDVVTTVVGAPWRELTFIELVTDDGRRGLGEVRMITKTDTLLACVSELAGRHIVGTDPFDVETLAFNIQRAEYGRPGEITQSALAAFDIACWDLIGQELGVPIWKLLGGRYRDRVRAYANGWYQTERDSAAVAECARDVVARGYTALKMDPFGNAWMSLRPAERRLSFELVAAVREAIGPDVELMIEMHGRFSAAAAVEIAAELEPFAPAWLEEPVPFDSPTGLARVRNATNRPIATGEPPPPPA